MFLEPEAQYLWDVWEELHGARSSGMASNPISWPDIDAYRRVLDDPLEPWEARAVRAIDDAYIEAVAASSEAAEGGD